MHSGATSANRRHSFELIYLINYLIVNNISPFKLFGLFRYPWCIFSCEGIHADYQ